MLNLNQNTISAANSASQYDAGSALAREAERVYAEGLGKMTYDNPNQQQAAILDRRLAEWRELVEKAYNDIIAKRAAWMPWTVCGPARYNSAKNSAKADRQMEAAAEWDRKMDAFIENTMRMLNDAIPLDEMLAQYRSGKRRDAISSDDPLAVEKLTARLDGMRERHEKRKQRNAWWRKHGTMKGCPDLSAESAAQIDAAIAADPLYKVPYAPYTMQNANAEMKRISERLQTIQAQRQQAAALPDGKADEEHSGFIVERRPADGRVNIAFDGKPDEDARAILKGEGFHWSPRAKVWTRKLTPNAERALCHIVDALQKLPAYAPQDAADPAEGDVPTLEPDEFAARVAQL
ncbi:MAG: hypothetical protein IJ523_10715 [Succinivibrionaceae bacterium]|nr:hypothetical protein [Succinivibrionaceae bacterium]